MFRVQGQGFRVENLGFNVQVLGCRVDGLGGYPEHWERPLAEREAPQRLFRR